MKKYFVILSLILLFANKGSYSQWVWQNPTSLPYNINQIKFINNSTGWCFCNYAKNYKTTDGGNSWSQYYFNPEYEISYSVLYKFDSTNTTLWLGTTAGTLIKSTNSGVNWNNISLPNPNNITHIFFLNSNTGYVTAKYLFKTTNSGNSWLFSDSASYLYDIYSSYFINNNTGWETAYHYEFIPPPVTHFYVRRTTNGGNSWTTIYDFQNSTNFYTPPLNIIFKDSLNGLIKFDNNIYQTINSGVSWNNIYSLGNFEFKNNSTGFTAGNNGFSKTTNFGNNWISRNYFPGLNPNCINVIDTANIFLGGNNGLLVKSTNGGINWINLINSITNKNIGFIKAFDSLNLLAFAQYNLLLKTSDGGNNWNCFDTSIFIGNKILSSFFVNLNTGWAGTSSGAIIKTTNAGINWTATSININIYKINVNNSGFGYAIGKSAILKTINFGENWVNIYQLYDTNNYEIADVSFTNQLNGYASVNNFYNPGSFIIRTSDGGLNWYNIHTNGIGGIFTNLIKFINDSVGYSDVNIYDNYFVTTTHNLNKTTNYGINWFVVVGFSENTLNRKYFSDILTYGNNNVYLIDRLGGYRASTNSGSTWQYTSLTSSSLNSITSSGKNIWVAGNNGAIIKGNNMNTVGITYGELILTKDYLLSQNYPNPFNPVTNIKYQIANNKYVTIKVYDLLGKEVASLVDKKQVAGIYEVNFDAENLSSGIYFYLLYADGVRMDTKRMVLVK